MSKRWDRRILSLSLIAIISNASYTTIAPILPLEIDKHHISERWTSIIFLAFPIGCTVVSFLAAKRLEEVGAEKVMTFGMTLMSVLFYCLSYVFQLVDGSSQLMNDEQTKATDRSLLVAGLTITQFFIGASMSMITTGYYSTATLIFPSAKESALSCIETSVGLGYIIGPIVGSALYDEMGYQSAYRCVSFVVMVMASILWKFLTVHLKQTDDYDVIPEDLAESDDHIEEDDDNVEAQHLADKPQSMNLTLQHHRNINNNHKMNPTTFSLLKQPQIFCAAMSILWINVSWSFLEPILAKRLELFQVGKRLIIPTPYTPSYNTNKQTNKQTTSPMPFPSLLILPTCGPCACGGLSSTTTSTAAATRFLLHPNPASAYAARAGASSLLAAALARDLWGRIPEWIREDDLWKSLFFTSSLVESEHENTHTSMGRDDQHRDEMASLAAVIQKLQGLIVTGFEKLGSEQRMLRRRRRVAALSGPICNLRQMGIGRQRRMRGANCWMSMHPTPKHQEQYASHRRVCAPTSVSYATHTNATSTLRRQTV
eukprot:g8984.t1 g8984   contig34:569653-572240(-)